MDVTELDKATKDVEKSLSNEGDDKKEPNLIAKALDTMSDMSKALIKKIPGMHQEPDGDEHNHKAGDVCKACGFGGDVKKSGETSQPHGDQNKFNVGEMSPKKAKLFEYLNKLDETKIEEIANTIAEYPNGAAVKKSVETDAKADTNGALEAALESGDVMVINNELMKGFAQIDEMKEILSIGLPAISKALVAILKSYQANGKAIEDAGFQPRGRISQDHVDKSITDMKLNPAQIMVKAQKLVKAGELDAVQVSLLETQMSDPQFYGVPDQRLIAKIEASAL